MERAAVRSDETAERQPATVSVDHAAKRLGISRGSAYAAVHRGEIPSIRIGGRLLIPAAALDRMLDGDPAV